jgi:hopene-associated glycosyltransferase HpnB
MMTESSLVIASIAFAIWVYLMAAHGGFWRSSVRDDRAAPPEPPTWPGVVAVIPARDEADNIATALGSLLSQNYPGPFRIVLVDDQSRDGTAVIAWRTATDLGPGKLTIRSGRPLPPGWAGKVWAMKQGIDWANDLPDAPDYLLLTDADIAYGEASLRRLVARATAEDLVLTSLMVRLHCDSWAERAFVPAFVFFFQMLFPFDWVRRSDRATAAAAGGCMLVRRDALAKAGGIETIRHALIDDCALGARLKSIGPIWLGLTESVRSLRPYPNVGDIRHMVVRSAYAQLHYSPLLLAGTIAGMMLTYLAPPFLAVFATGLPQVLGGLTWLMMALSFQPTLRLYGRSQLWGAALPAIAAVYVAFTVDSAYQHLRGRGGLWKGRVQAGVSGMPQ